MSSIFNTGYRYYTTNLWQSGTEPEKVICELSFTGVNFTQELNSIGTFTGHILLSGIDVLQLNVQRGTDPGKTALYVQYNETIVWGGVIWGRNYNSDTQTLIINAQEFESYLDKRFINDTYVYYQTEIFDVVSEQLASMQVNDATQNGNIGIVLPTYTPSGVLITRTIHRYENKSFYELLQDLSRNAEAFDFRIAASFDFATLRPKKTLLLGHPNLGSQYDPILAQTDPVNYNDFVFSFPGNITMYEYDEDASTMANELWAIGAGSNEGMLLVHATDETKFVDNWPSLETTHNYVDMIDAKYLEQIALSQLNSISLPPVHLRIVVPSYGEPEFGQYKLGDTVRVVINDTRFPGVINPATGLLFEFDPEIWPYDTYIDKNYRIVAINVSPGEDGPDRVTLSLTLPPADTGSIK